MRNILSKNILGDIPAAPTDWRGCQGGWIRHFDTDYPCSGCFQCQPAQRAMYVLARWLILFATYKARREATAMIALARIGQAIASVGRPFMTLAKGLGDLGASYFVVRKGRWVRVVSRRGRNAPPIGTEGEVTWLKESEQYGTLRAGIRAADGTMHWTPASNLQVIVPPDSVREAQAQREAAYQAKRAAERAAHLAKPEADAKRGDVVGVTEGRDKGASGEVFWVGPSKDNSGMRCGFRDTATGRTVWASLRDVEVVAYGSIKAKGKKSKKGSWAHA